MYWFGALVEKMMVNFSAPEMGVAAARYITVQLFVPGVISHRMGTETVGWPWWMIFNAPRHFTSSVGCRERNSAASSLPASGPVADGRSSAPTRLTAETQTRRKIKASLQNPGHGTLDMGLNLLISDATPAAPIRKCA